MFVFLFIDVNFGSIWFLGFFVKKGWVLWVWDEWKKCYEILNSNNNKLRIGLIWLVKWIWIDLFLNVFSSDYRYLGLILV